MDVKKLLKELYKKGIDFSLNGENLNIHAKKDAITPEVLAAIKSSKEEIKATLSELSGEVKTLSSVGKITRILRTEESYLLSYAQQRLWLTDKMRGGSHEYNIAMALLISSTGNAGQIFDITSAEKAISRIIARHESLRTVIEEREEGPVQVIKNYFQFNIPRYDLSGLDQGVQDIQADQLIKNDHYRKFDLSADLMIRASYLQLSAIEDRDSCGILLFSIHHIVSDGWSMKILVKEFIEHYQAVIQGKPDLLPSLPVQYLDYTHWQRKSLAEGVQDNQLAYWKKQLEDIPSVHSLPLDYPRPEIKKYEGAIVKGHLSPAVSKKLYELIRKKNITLFMLLQGILALVLSRHSNAHDIILGTPVANRLQSELEPLIGFFINTLVLRTNTNYKNLNDYFSHVRQVNLTAQENQDIPFEQLLESCSVNRSAQYTPLFQIMFSMNTLEASDLSLPGLNISTVSKNEATARFDLTVSANATENGCYITWLYDTAIFSQAHIRQLNDHYQRLLLGVIENPDADIVELPILSKKEIQLLVHEWNNTERDYPQYQLIHELFEAQVAKMPDNIAVVYGDQRWTYLTLNKAANRLAHYLVEQGVYANTLVGLCTTRSIDMLVGVLAILKAGGAYLPLDPNYPEQRIESIVNDSCITIIVSQKIYVQKIPFQGKTVVLLDAEYEGLSTENITDLDDFPTKKHLAYVIYTSGSTGRPKGVLISHANVVNFLTFAQRVFMPDFIEGAVVSSSLNFDATVGSLYPPLCCGRYIELLPDDENIIHSLADSLFDRQRSLLFKITPAHMNAIIDGGGEKRKNKQSRHILVIAGETLYERNIHTWQQSLLPLSVFINEYGPTEATVGSTTFDGINQLQMDSFSSCSIPIGQPLDNIRLYILNDSRQLLPAGSIGELYIGGAGVALGYLNRPELTQERFIVNPFANNTDDRLYRTGDLVRYLSDGNIEFISRIDSQIKIRGFRIEPGEIEYELMNSDYIDSSLVLAYEDESQQKKLVAYVILIDKQKSKESKIITQIRQHCEAVLPDFMVPSVFIPVMEWPLSTNGKIDRKRLPKADLDVLQESYVAPVTESEKLMVDIWAKVLKLNAKKISITANFFQLGGHSLVALKLASYIRTHLKQEISIKAIIESPDIRSLSAVIDATSYVPVRKPVTPIDRDNNLLPLSFAQQRLWFINRLQGETPEYNMPVALLIEGENDKTRFDINAAEQAITRIIQRHESLRTTFGEKEGRALQVINEAFCFSISCHDLSKLNKKEQDIQINKWINKDRSEPFKLESDLMVRSSYLQLGDAKEKKSSGILLFNMHHIASDGWSRDILVGEFVQHYDAIVHGKADSLPALSVQYGDYAYWQREWLQGEVLKQQLYYWRKQLKEIPLVHSLPLDYPRPAMKTHDGAIVRGQLSSALGEQLQNLALEKNMTLFMLLHGALGLLLSRHGNSHDIVLGTPVANRTQTELEPLIGFFVNTLILRIKTNVETLNDYLAHVKQTNLDAQANQDIPFEFLVEDCQVTRSMQYSPLFQIMLSMNTKKDHNLVLPGLKISSVVRKHIAARFDLELFVESSSDGLHLIWLYDKSLFSNHRIEQLNNHFKHLLESMLVMPESKISELSILSRQEEDYFVHTLNNTQQDYPQDKLIHELFEVQVTQSPDRTAVVCNDKQLTYRQLNEAANRLAHYLREQGVGVETLVGLCVHRSLDMVVGLLAILKAGGAYVPMDINNPQARLQYIVEDTGLRYLLVDSGFNIKLHAVDLQLIEYNTSTFQQQLQAYPVTMPERLSCQSFSNSVYVIYTSGSTGQPKGVVVEHSALLNLLLAMQERFCSSLSQPLSLLAVTTISFDIAGLEIFAPLLQGGELILASVQDTINPTRLFQLLIVHDVNCLQATPATWQLLLSHQWQGKADLLALCGGEILPSRLADNLLPRCYQLWNCYGPTEATVWSLVKTIDNACVSQKQIYIGGPLGNYRHYVLNNDKQVVPTGVVGELFIGGKGIARGYLNRPQLTQEKFIFHSFTDNQQELLYKTGDWVRYSTDGNLEFIGRVDEQIKLRGYRIEPGEIESLLQEHTAIEKALVLTQGLDNEEKKLVAYLQLNHELLNSYTSLDSRHIKECQDTSQLTMITSQLLPELRILLMKQLPSYMLPTGYLLLERFPLLVSGKIDKSALPRVVVSDEGDYIAPDTFLERQLQGIWAELLNIPEVSIEADFFSLGGHSLLVIRLLNQVRKQLFVELQVKDIFEHSSIKTLARHIEKQSETSEGKKRSAMIFRQERSSGDNKILASFAQQRLWFIDQLQNGSTEYNMSLALRIEGSFNIKVAEQAFVRIIQRHEVLRTIFEETEDGLVQLIKESFQFKIDCDDLSGCIDEAVQTRRVDELISRERCKPFSLNTDLMIRVSYLSLSNEEIPVGILIFTTHHIASDAWSMQVLIKEFVAYYQSLIKKEADSLPSLPIQYADYAHWQREWLQGEVLTQQMNYWLKQLQDIPSVHSLPLDYPRPAIKRYEGAVLKAHVHKDISESLEKLAGEKNMTLFMLMHGILGLVLSRHSNRRDIVLGTPVANRTQVELESLIGFFVNTLVLRSSTDYKKFSDYLQHVKQVNLDAQANQDVPFEYLVEHSSVSRSMQYTPLFQILLTMHINERKEINLPDLLVTAVGNDEVSAKFDLTINIRRTENGLYFSWIYDKSLFHEKHIKQINDHTQSLLQHIVKKYVVDRGDFSDVVLADFSILSAEEIHYLIHQLNDTEISYPEDRLIHELFEQQVKKTPDHTAVIFENQQLTYRELNEEANRLAHYLKEQGVRINTLVGLCASRSIAMLRGLLAILKAGGAYVPLGPDYPRLRIQSILDDADIDIVVTQQAITGTMPFKNKKLVWLDKSYVEYASGNLKNPKTRQRLAYVIYTSGSSGEPKGVVLSHKNVVNFLCFARRIFMPAHLEGAVVNSTLSFDATVGSLYPPLICGQYVELLRDDENIITALTARLFDEKRSLLFKLTPAHLEAVVSMKEERPNNLSRHIVVVAGETLYEKSISLWQKKLLPSSVFINEYGPTEATVGTTVFYYSESVIAEHNSLTSVPIGRPLDNTQVYVLNEIQQLLPVGTVGELYIGGCGVACGYLNKPELTQEKFIRNSFSSNTEERLYKTGDSVRYLTDGNLEFIGRLDEQVKIRGYRIELGEITNQLSYFEGIASAIVVVNTAEDMQKCLVAYVIPDKKQQNEKALTDQLRQYCRAVLPDYMVPAFFIQMEEWPLNSNGKIDKTVLPEPDGLIIQKEYIAPDTKEEKALVLIWGGLLKLDPDVISANTDFFELGGHSLLAVNMVAQIKAKMACTLSVKDVFLLKDIKRIAKRINLIKVQSVAEENMSSMDNIVEVEL